MAPVRESTYFPPLDKCLDGRHQLFSWRTTYFGLQELEGADTEKSLERHLTDSHTLELLRSSLLLPTLPTAQTKSTFETKTSAINVVPSAQGRFDIKQIQDDTLWLSAKATIDEVTALRIVILEWQSRPAFLLQKSDRQSFGGSFNGSSFQPTLSAVRPTPEFGRLSDDAVPAGSINSEETRRKRLFSIYLEERLYKINTCGYLLRNAHKRHENGENNIGQRSSAIPHWVEEIGYDILANWDVPGIGINVLRSRIRDLEEGCRWFSSDEMQESIMVEWCRSQILEMVAILDVTLNALAIQDQLPPYDFVRSWFKLMNDYGFFEEFQPPLRDLYDTHELDLQSLCSLVSLAVLKVPAALEAFTPKGRETDDAGYLQNVDTCGEITEIMINAASERLQVASPAVLAWSLILQRLRERSIAARDEREDRLSMHGPPGIVGSPEAETLEQPLFKNSRSLLRRGSSTGSDTPQQQSFLEQLVDTVMSVSVDGDPVAYLARAAVDGSHVLNIIATLSTSCYAPSDSDQGVQSNLRIRRILMDLVGAVLGLIDYQPDLVATTLAVLSGNEDYWGLLHHPMESHEIKPAAMFMEDDIFMTKIFAVALSRFPFEVLPFLRLCRALASSHAGQDGDGLPAIWSKLATTDCLTCVLPASFTDYQLLPDDEESSIISLTADLDMFDHEHTTRSMSYKRLKQSGGSAPAHLLNLRQIPQGTTGRVLSETKPLVVLWRHDYCPLAYLGMLLHSASSIEPSFGNSPQSHILSPEAIAEIIDLLSIILLTSIRGTSASKASLSAFAATQKILDTASEGLDLGQDIVSVIFDIFEKELGRQPKPTEEAPLIILLRCTQFAEALLHVMPDRVWPFLGRSSLLGVNDSDSQLGTVLASTEMVLGKYDLLLGCVHLFESLADDAISHAVIRKSPTKSVARFAASRSHSTGVSQVAMKKVLLSFQRILLDVYQSIPTWNFAVIEQRHEINTRLSISFNRLLTCCFGIEGQSDTNQKLTASLMPAVEQIVRIFVSSAGAENTLTYMIRMIQEGVTEALSSEPRSTLYGIQQTVEALRLATTVLRLNTIVGLDCSPLEEKILRHVSLLARCYTSHPIFRHPVIELLTVLVLSADVADGQPASLLGHMGEDAASQFLQVLATIDEPLCHRDVSVSIWKLLSAVVSKRQQWFAIFVLTGEAPRKLIKRKITELDNRDRSDSIFGIALDRLSNIGRSNAQRALAILEFVALAADSWPWTLAIAEQHPRFITSITEYISQVETVTNTTQNRLGQAGMEYYKLQMTSYITEILAMYTHHTRQASNTSYAKELLPNLTYVTTAAVIPPEYNASLHSNLRQNFEDRFENCKLTAFKRTTLKLPSLGESFYYDLDIASQILHLDSSWTGRDQEGFAAELARANVNFSVVEARISLFHSWKLLAVELSKSLGTDSDYQKSMADVTMDCLRANTKTTLPQAIFERLAQSRADLAFTLLQSLIEEQSTRAEVKSVLFTAWDALRAHGTDLAIALDGDQAPYCRTLLKILCLSLQAHTSSRTVPSSVERGVTQPEYTQKRPTDANLSLTTVLKILKLVVANGFRSLTTLLHDSPGRIFPDDFALLAAILRNSLRIPGLERHTTALLSTFADAQTSRYASTLLSWSDQLATNRDPIYGEMSVNFLLEMSSMPALAEALAVEGILNHMSDTNLIKLLRISRGMGPFDQPVRLYNIWVRGILPLLLNLLHAVGASVAAEISAALNQFPGQLERASATFAYYGKVPATNESDPSSAGYISLSMISEAQTLAVISRMLDTYRDAGPSAGVVSSEIMEIMWDRLRVKEDVQTWLQTRSVLRERIVPMGEREQAWAKMRPGENGSSRSVNKLEEKVVEDLEQLMTLLGGKDD
ncbi:MAG: hypothetical protein L6R42_002911 [Xanthoria sp. 1 TBL-2021]|nr:MAG: hypothetical protein L6R42_002911 [Xanthoria sp. 1 TBL-2021]